MTDEAGPGNYSDVGDMSLAGEVKTSFAAGKDLESLKDMVLDAKPELVLDVADTWKAVHDHLASGSGSIKSDLDRAVEHVLKHWEGDAADEFAKKARKLSRQIADCATYAGYTSVAMRNAGERLQEIKPQLDAIGKPAGKWGHGIRSGFGTPGALNSHDADPASGKEAQAEAAELMERLAVTYSSQTRVIGSWKRPSATGSAGEGGTAGKDRVDYPGHPGGVAPVPVTPVRDGPPPGRSGVFGGGDALERRTPKPPRATGTSAAAMRPDGVSGGTSTAPRGGAPSARGGAPNAGAPSSGLSGNGVAAVPGPTAAGAGLFPGGLGAAGRRPGGLPPAGREASGRRPGNAAGAGRGAAGAGSAMKGRLAGGLGASTGTGAGAGTGTGGGEGSGAGRTAGGAGGDGKRDAGGRGSQVRGGGAPLDAPLHDKSPSRQGGQGLHSSRGGAMAGGRGRSGGGTWGIGLAGDGTADDAPPTKYDRKRSGRPYNFGVEENSRETDEDT